MTGCYIGIIYLNDNIYEIEGGYVIANCHRR